jgi:hypothetical protein
MPLDLVFQNDFPHFGHTGCDCLRIAASQGVPDRQLNYLATVRRDANTISAAAFTQRMRVVVNDLSTSPVFRGPDRLANQFLTVPLVRPGPPHGLHSLMAVSKFGDSRRTDALHNV